MKTRRRTSLKAVNLANDVITKLKAKERINLKELSVANGYSLKSALAQKGVRTKTYQSLVVPVIDRMKRLHEKALISLDNRDLDKERIDSVVNLAKQMVHDSQLLSGKSTENVANNIVIFGEDDFLATQVNR